MSGFDSILPAPIEVSLAGKVYVFSLLRFRDHAEAAARMRSGWVAPAEAVRRIGGELAPELQRQLLEIAYRDERRGAPVELEDVLRWYRTPEGMVFHKWLMLRGRQPELALDDVDELLSAVDADAAETLTEAAAEADGLPRGNFWAPPPDAAAGLEATARGSHGKDCSPI